MKFLQQAIKNSNDPKLSIIQVINNNVGGYEKARGYKVIHASDLTKSNFCPREVAILDITKSTPKDQYIPTALKTTFDMGNAVADLFRENWAGKTAIGNWHCRKCSECRTFCRRPDEACKFGGRCTWVYDEVNLVSKTHNFSGSIDVILDLASPKMFVTELKIMAPDQFEKLQAPLSEHRLRTALYMYLVDDSLSPFRHHINTQVGKVLYVSRGYGKKNQEADGAILPLKEYNVARDDAAIASIIDKAAQINLFRTKGIMPACIHSDPVTAKKKGCEVVQQNFSDQWPPGSMVPLGSKHG